MKTTDPRKFQPYKRKKERRTNGSEEAAKLENDSEDYLVWVMLPAP